MFRDWRFALMWVVGISALASAFFARCGGHEELLAKPQPEASATAPAPAASPAPIAAPAVDAEDEQEKFGESVMDTTGFEPSPPEPEESASASPQATSAPAPEEQ